MKKKERNSKSKVKFALICAITGTLAFSNVLAREIDIYAVGNVTDGSAEMRIYSSIHSNKLAAAIRKEKNKNDAVTTNLIADYPHTIPKISGVTNLDYLNPNEINGTSATYYLTTGFTLHNKEKSTYGSSANDGTLYSYAKYDSSTGVGQATGSFYSSHKVGRPKEVTSGIKQSQYTLLSNGAANKKIEPLKLDIVPIQAMLNSKKSLHDTQWNNALANDTANNIKKKIVSLRDFYVVANDYKIPKSTFLQMMKDVEGYAVPEKNGNEYVYISEIRRTKGGWLPYGNDARDNYTSNIVANSGNKNKIIRKADSAAEYYNNIFPANGYADPNGWSSAEKGATHDGKSRVPLASAINAYDNKLHFKNPEQKIVVTYIDIGKDDDTEIDRTITGKTTIIEKTDRDEFTTEEIEDLIIDEKELEKDKDGNVDLEVPEEYEYIGYNADDEEQEYDLPKILIGHKDEHIYKVPETDGEIHIDVFVNSKKRVYVRHINMSSYYRENLSRFENFNYEKLNQTNLLLSAGSKRSILYDRNGDLIRNKTPNYSTREYSECHIIPWDSVLEVTNLNTDSKKYKKHYSVSAYNKDTALRAKQQTYNVGVMQINNADKDIRVITNGMVNGRPDTRNTYIDMFYVEDSIVPAGCSDPRAEAGKTITPEGKLMFEATDSKFANSTKNEFDVENMIMDKIPSSEELRYGVLDLKEYIISRADTKCISGVEKINNGKNIIEVQYEYNNPKVVSFFGLEDSVKMYDSTSQIGSTLFTEESKAYNIPLKSSFKQGLENARIREGGKSVINSSYGITSCPHCHGSICKNYFAEIKIENMSLTYKNKTLIPSYPMSTGKIEYRKERCKVVDGKAVIDPMKTVYITPDVTKLEVAGYEDKVKVDVNNANNSAKIRKMSDIYVSTNKATIPLEKYNGIRVLSGEFGYKLIPNASKGTPVDKINRRSLFERKTEVEEVSVHTPVIAKVKLETTGDFVNHTGEEIDAENIIQKNVPFKVTPLTTGVVHPTYPEISDFKKYTDKHIVKFNFDLEYVEYYRKGATRPYTRKDEIIPAGEWIEIKKGEYIKAQTVYDPNEVEGQVAEAIQSQYDIKTVAKNEPKTLAYMEAIETNDSLGDSEKNIGILSHRIYHNLSFENEYKYMAYKKQEAEMLGRIYDFRITDFVDIDWKNVFRKSDAMTHTGRFYYSGTHGWNMLSADSNQMVRRSVAEIGKKPLRVLPVGPYKHTNTGYTKAPKLGYKFTFDVKTTGSLTNSVKKQVKVTPKFYYISKDGKTFKEDIFLYYKNSSGRFIKVGSSADTYKITMRPADGLRHLAEYDKSYNKTNLSTNIISVGNLDDIILKQTTNMASNDNAFLQIWYGEYKLPNSTIAVDARHDDISNPLKNGYIGIKFDISCEEYKDGQLRRTIYYNTKDLNAKKENTSQWDYEKYLGSNAGQSFNGSLKLPSGTWNINNSTYQKIKGTVALYDTDERAADEFDIGSVN